MTTQREARTVKRLIDEFGAEVMVSVRDYVPLDKRVRGQRRVSAGQFINDCTGCDLHLTSPIVTPEWPSPINSPARIAVVGEAPGPEEVKHDRPFVGRAGRVLRGALQAAGMSPDDVVYTNAVSCMPTTEDVLRPPSAIEQHACHRNLTLALDAADVRYVLLLGVPAVRAWRADVQLNKVAGKMFTWRNRWFVYPMWHPNAVLRQAFSPVEWREQLGRFAQYVADDAGTSALHRKCIECSAAVHAFDEDGVPWCVEHFTFHQSAAQDKTRSRVNTQDRFL